ncbi:hypothetical protein 000TH008_11 [Bacillus phage 000TH008]|nr:hypothetical protein 000TH008_11 [Bacillus phage 000TH008]QQO40705.1 hypothetical protein 000TH009_11 [Bacillus phage 000TH009]
MGTIIDSIVDSIHMVNTIFVGIGWLFFIVMWVLFDFIKAVGCMITLYILLILLCTSASIILYISFTLLDMVY